MTEFNVGDRVILNDDGVLGNHSGVGVVTGLTSTTVEIDFEEVHGVDRVGPLTSYPRFRVSLAGPKFVQSITKTVGITLPGDDKSHLLSAEDARQLLRELEEVV